MNQELVISTLRTVLQVVGTLLAANPSVTKYISPDLWKALSDQIVALTGAGMLIGSTIWMLVAKWKSEK